MIDPIDHDLNRHLAEQDRNDARGEAIDEIVDEILADQCKGRLLQDVVCTWLEQDADAHKTIAAAIASGDLDGIKDDAQLRALLTDEAGKEYDKRQAQAEMDAAEARDEARQAAREGW